MSIKKTFTVYILKATNAPKADAKGMVFSRQAQADQMKETLKLFGVDSEITTEKRTVDL